MNTFILGYDDVPEWLWQKIFKQEAIIILKNGIYDNNTKLKINEKIYESGSKISEDLFKK
jgi:hypothetical protein